ncbi:MAG TPA: glycoside hydrolase, partial [Terriglobales bacterium]|nr:glycoside hydrolase [Terriglobales bacterium]
GSVGALAVAPSDPNIIYVGSGEGIRRPDLSVGDGIYKSTDAGKTWTHLGLRDAQQINAIIIDPRDPSRLFVAAMGHPYGPNAERGVFRSTDGGQTFSKVLYKDENVGAIDLAFDPANSQTIYASLWNSRRPPWTTGGAMNGPGSGLYKSTDGGNTWNQLTGGLPTEAQGLGRIGITVAPSDPSRLYAWVSADPANGGIFRSDDAGQDWRRVSNEQRVWGRGDDFAVLRVDPKNKDVLYAANTSTYRSTDGGTSWTAIKGAPGGDDYHNIWINPDNPDIMLFGVDQGATITVNGGATWSSWYNQPTAQFYHVSTDNRFPYWVCGGQQESGSACTRSRSDYGAITFRDWHTVGTEEYGYVAPDPLHPGVFFGGKATRYDERTTQTQEVSPEAVRSGKYRFNRTAPLVFSAADPRALYLGSNVLFKTTNGGRSWEIVSPDLTRENPGVPANLGIFAQNREAQTPHRGVIYSIAPSPKDPNLIWVGTDDGVIQVTRDGGKNWSNVTPPDLTAWSKVAQMDASHFDPQTAYAAINRFRLDDLRAYIYRTHDGGRTWQKITTGIPDDAPVNVVREDPVQKGLLFAGTEKAVWFSVDDGDHWQSLQLNLPITSMRDLVIHGDDVVVGTHGRSFWILDDVAPLRQLASLNASAPHLFAPATAVRVRRSTASDTPLPPEEPAGQNPPDGAMIDYYLPSAPSGGVVLDIVDGSGKVVRRYASDDKPEPIDPKELNVPTYWVRQPKVLSAAPGMHRWIWDLHFAPLASLESGYPISAIPHDTPREPLGVRALPGRYTVRLTLDGRSFTQPLTVDMDPRVTASAADLNRQFALENRLADALRQDLAALDQVRSVRQQLAKNSGALSEQAKPFVDALAAFEGGRGGRRGASGSGFSPLNANLTAVYSVVDSADAAPTTQAEQAADTFLRDLQQELIAWQQWQTQQLPSLNNLLRQSNLPPITVPPARP